MAMAASHFALIFRDLVHDGYEFNKLCFVKDGFAEPETSRWPSNYQGLSYRKIAVELAARGHLTGSR